MLQAELEAPIERGYLRFEHYGFTPLTKKWHVYNKVEMSLLCDIEYYGPWSGYVISITDVKPDEKLRFSLGCMRDIMAFIEEKMKERRRYNDMGTEQCPKCKGFMQVGSKEAYARDGDKTVIVRLAVKYCPKCQHTESEDYKKKVKAMGLKPY